MVAATFRGWPRLFFYDFFVPSSLLYQTLARGLSVAGLVVDTRAKV